MSTADRKTAARLGLGSHLEESLVAQLRLAGLPAPVREHRFALAAGRQYRFDLAWPAAMVAAEVEGGVYARTPGRHNRGAGFREDCVKYNLAAELGWRVVRFEDRLIQSGEALATLARLLAPKEATGA